MLGSKVRDVQSLSKTRHSIHETSGDQNVHDIILPIVVWRNDFCQLGFIYLLLSEIYLKINTFALEINALKNVSAMLMSEHNICVHLVKICVKVLS